MSSDSSTQQTFAGHPFVGSWPELMCLDAIAEFCNSADLLLGHRRISVLSHGLSDDESMAAKGSIRSNQASYCSAQTLDRETELRYTTYLLGARCA